MTRFLILLASVCAASLWCASASAVEIQNDFGGVVIEYLKQNTEYTLSKEPVRIGRWGTECDSACTIFLSNPKACVYSEGRFGFHSAAFIYSDVQMILPKDHIANEMLTSGYKKGLKKLWNTWYDTGAFGKHNAPVFLTGWQLHSLFGYRLCQ